MRIKKILKMISGFLLSIAFLTAYGTAGSVDLGMIQDAEMWRNLLIVVVCLFLSGVCLLYIQLKK